MNETAPSLNGCRVWVTRPRDRAAALCALVRAAGGEPVTFPLVEIAPAPDAAAARAQLAGVGTGPDIFIFVSPAAVHGALALQPDLPTLLANGQVYAVGGATAAELVRLGICATTGPGPAFGAADLLTHPGLREDVVRGRTVLIVKGVGGEPALAETLVIRGARVHQAEVYRRVPPRPDPEATAALWHRAPPDVIVLTSAGAVAALVMLTPALQQARLRATALVVISARVAATARGAGFTGAVQVAAAATDPGLLEALLSWKIQR